MKSKELKMVDKKDVLSILPPHIYEALKKFKNITDISLSVGQRIYVIDKDFVGKQTLNLVFKMDDYEFILKEMENWNGEEVKFGSDLRSGIMDHMTRISKIPGSITGLSIRFGKSIPDSCRMIEDIIRDNILIMGEPGVGKTTLLRSVAGNLSQAHTVVIVDDSGGELTGYISVDKSVDKCIIARGPSSHQHKLIQQSIESHAPEFIIVDEIGDPNEVNNLLNAVPKGVKVIATCHGNDLSSMINSSTLSKLLGTINSVTLKADIARQQGLPQQSVNQRTGNSLFNKLVQVASPEIFVIYHDLAKLTDLYLAFKDFEVEIRSPLGFEWSTYNNFPERVEEIKLAMSQANGSNLNSVSGLKKVYAPRVKGKSLAYIQAKYEIVSSLDKADIAVYNLNDYSKALIGGKLPSNIPVFIESDQLKNLI